MFEQDYIMRLIHEVIKTLLKLLFHIDIEKKEDEDILLVDKEVAEKYEGLLDLIDNGMINEAENKLFDDLDPADTRLYMVALMFYSYLNEKDIGFLEEHNYSKNEIIEGLKYVSSLYGKGSIADAMLSILID